MSAEGEPFGTRSLPRAALYWAPAPETALWQLGSAVLGYDAASGLDLPALVPEGQTPETWAALTAEPRRYGFHATLKAPFELAQGRSREELAEACARTAPTLARVPLPDLAVREVGPFLAITCGSGESAIQALALKIVEAFEPFRAPLSPEDRARRLRSPLSERQVALLDRFGYPHVAEEFELHLTLTGPIADEALRARLRLWLDARLAEALARDGSPPALDRLCLFEQASREARFHIRGAWPLG